MTQHPVAGPSANPVCHFRVSAEDEESTGQFLLGEGVILSHGSDRLFPRKLVWREKL